MKILIPAICSMFFLSFSHRSLGYELREEVFTNSSNDIRLEARVVEHNISSTFKGAKEPTLSDKNYFVENDTLFSLLEVDLMGVSLGVTEWGDYDGDGDLDILVSGTLDVSPLEGGTFLYKNMENGEFKLQDQIELVSLFQGSWSWTDFDGDGDLDLFGSGLVRVDGFYEKKSFLYNNRDGTFEKVEYEFKAFKNCVSKWSDLDNDGDLDLLLSGVEFSTNASAKTMVYVNEGNGSFLELDLQQFDGVEFGEIIIEDLDNDDDNDIILVGDPGYGNKIGLYENLGRLSFEYIETPSLNIAGLSTIDAGDFDFDGDLDLVVGGNMETKILENLGNLHFSYVLTNIAFHKAYSGNVRFADISNDGLLDIYVNGSTDIGRLTTIYINEGNSSFTKIGNQGIANLSEATSEFADYDNDGDLDLLVSGASTNGRITNIYTNNISKANEPPEKPTALVSYTDFDDVTISWEKASDDLTHSNSLTYNYYLGQTPDSINIGSPLSDVQTGTRKITNKGNAGTQTSWTFRDLPNGDYYFAIQAIDDMSKASPFSKELSFSVSEKDPPTGPINLKAVSTSSTSIRLKWLDHSEDEIFYKVERSYTGLTSEFDSIGFVNASNFEYMDSVGLSPENLVFYRVVSVADDGKISESETVDAITLNSLSPSNLTVRNIFPSSMTIQWDDMTLNESAFLIEKSTDGQAGNFQLVADLKNTMTSLDTLSINT